MYTVSAVLDILALNIILSLVLVIVCREKNNVFGHAQKDGSPGSYKASGGGTAVRPQTQGDS